ncbi:MAG: hypothetical protein H3C54_03685 [Taibaiella sp.]|nr:hypothetical protein [Taibaiella sp.]
MTQSDVKLLTSTKYLDNVEGLDTIIRQIEEISPLIVSTLVRAEIKDFISERIFQIVNVMIDSLVKEFNRSTCKDVRLNIALILFSNDINGYEDFLVEYVTSETNYDNVAFPLMKLATKKVERAKPVVQYWLDIYSEKAKHTADLHDLDVFNSLSTIYDYYK